MTIVCPPNSSICDTMGGAGAGIGVFIDYLGQALPTLLIVLALVGKKYAHNESNLIMQNPEYRGNSSDRQSRSVTTFYLNEYARTSDNGFPLGRICTLNLCNNLNMKHKINKFDNCGDRHGNCSSYKEINH